MNNDARSGAAMSEAVDPLRFRYAEQIYLYTQGVLMARAAYEDTKRRIAQREWPSRQKARKAQS